MAEVWDTLDRYIVSCMEPGSRRFLLLLGCFSSYKTSEFLFFSFWKGGFCGFCSFKYLRLLVFVQTLWLLLLLLFRNTRNRCSAKASLCRPSSLLSCKKALTRSGLGRMTHALARLSWCDLEGASLTAKQTHLTDRLLQSAWIHVLFL